MDNDTNLLWIRMDAWGIMAEINRQPEQSVELVKTKQYQPIIGYQSQPLQITTINQKPPL